MSGVDVSEDDEDHDECVSSSSFSYPRRRHRDGADMEEEERHAASLDGPASTLEPLLGKAPDWCVRHEIIAGDGGPLEAAVSKGAVGAPLYLQISDTGGDGHANGFRIAVGAAAARAHDRGEDLHRGHACLLLNARVALLGTLVRGITRVVRA